MAKKAAILIRLVAASREKNNSELEREIFCELSKDPTRIPWMKDVLKVKVIGD